MKNLIWILILLPIFSYSQTGKINIRDGESCSYNIHYGFFSGGYAKYSVDKKDKEKYILSHKLETLQQIS